MIQMKFPVAFVEADGNEFLAVGIEIIIQGGFFLGWLCTLERDERRVFIPESRLRAFYETTKEAWEAKRVLQVRPSLEGEWRE